MTSEYSASGNGVSTSAVSETSGLTTSPVSKTISQTDGLIVTTAADIVAADGLTSLREAVDLANNQAGADTITFDPTVFSGGAASVLRLVQGQIEITESLTIDGSTATDVLITGDANNDDITDASGITDVALTLASGAALTDGIDNDGDGLVDAADTDGENLLDDNSRLFFLPRNDLTIESLTLTGGRTTADSENGVIDNPGPGGAILGNPETTDVVISNSLLAGNSTAGRLAHGGAVHAQNLSIVNSTISQNSTSGDVAKGGGAFVVGGRALVENSIIAQNTTSGDLSDGGGIAGLVSPLTITNSSVIGNKTEGDRSQGGGVYSNGSVNLTDSTVAMNATYGDGSGGGGVYAGDALFNSSTISSNKTFGQSGVGAGARIVLGSLYNVTIAGNTTYGPASSGGGAFTGSVSFVNSTITGNRVTDAASGGGGIVGGRFGARLEATNTIVLGNSSAQSTAVEIGGTLVDLGGNVLAGDPSAVFQQTQVNGLALAGVLADNGGPVETVALRADAANPALDVGVSTLTADAVGNPRAIDLAGVDNGGPVDAGALELTALPPSAPPPNRLDQDFNGDGFDDILWLNTVSQQVGFYQMGLNGTFTFQDLGFAGPGYTSPASGDFNGDTIDDILWFNDMTGQVGYYAMGTTGQDPTFTWVTLPSPGAGYQIAGAGDFNADGLDEVLWLNGTTQDVGYYSVINAQSTWQGLGTAGADYVVVGTDDFNGDGTTDILWLNTQSKQVGFYEMAADTFVWRDLGVAGADFEVAGTGDFNSDSIDDVLWLNTATRQVGYYALDQNAAFTWQDLGIANQGYEVADVANYDRGGADDILWFNASTREVGYYNVDGASFTWQDLGVAGADYRVVAEDVLA